MTEDKITCQLCNGLTHAIQVHLKEDHPGVTLEAYKERFPLAPLLSKTASDRLAARRVMAAATPAPAASVAAPASASAAEIVKSAVTSVETRIKRPFHEVFKLGAVKAAMSSKGDPIMISVNGPHEYAEMVPVEDPSYIFNIDLLKTAMMGLELNIPSYLWGHAGTGKTTLWEQVCHYLNLPAIRVQHTMNTEEAHVLGQTLANESGTYFEPGFLPLAMKHGWVYLADEYDRAVPGVTSAYQAVLEGKPLVIKEAPPEWRVIKPHPSFRFVATGNSNGSGDESNLYPSTMIQDAANYSRFGIVEKVDYMPSSQEQSVLMAKAGVAKEDATKLVEFASQVRKQFEAKQISNPVGPRELIYAAIVGARRGNFRAGIKLAFSNKLPTRSQLAVDGFAQRIFG